MDEASVATEIKIKEVKNKGDFKKFLEFPQHLYSGDKNWVPKLDIEIKHLLSDKNPFYRHARRKLFIALRKGQAVGRVAAIVDDNFISFQEQKTGFFGFFESIDSEKVARALLNRCQDELKKEGLEKILGPMNPSSNDEMGFLLEGYDSPARIMMPYNPPYYHKLMQECGYQKKKDLLAFNMEVSQKPRRRLEKFVGKIKKRYPGLNCRPINKKEFNREVNLVKDIYNSAWKKNWAFVPWTDEEITDLAKNLKPLVIRNLVQICFFNEDPAGFLLALPDYNEVFKKTGRKLFPLGWLKFLINKNKIANLRLMAMGVKKEYQNKGVGALMYYNSLLGALEKGYKECEFSWILEDNEDTIKIARMMGGRVYKRYRVYGRNLTS